MSDLVTMVEGRRKQLKESQNLFCRRFGLDPATYSKIINPKSPLKFPRRTLSCISELLSKPIEEVARLTLESKAPKQSKFQNLATGLSSTKCRVFVWCNPFVGQLNGDPIIDFDIQHVSEELALKMASLKYSDPSDKFLIINDQGVPIYDGSQEQPWGVH